MTLIDNLAARIGYVKDTKAATGPGVVAIQAGVPLQWGLTSASPQARMRKYLSAYRSGWFYKAGSVIAQDVASLDWYIEQDEEKIEPTTGILADIATLIDRPNPDQTRRALWEQTQIRLDMAGNAFWYLEGGVSRIAAPTAIYGISPARMTPSRDRTGAIIGWVMDAEGERPVPFAAEEILHFRYATESDDIWGVGVVEAVLNEAEISGLLSRHTADVLSTGGRLAGMIAPKNRGLDAPEYEQTVRSWRNVTNDPASAKRLLVMAEPMEWTNTSASMADLNIPGLSELNRDNILTAFPISPLRLGIVAPAGLNSGDSRAIEERDYWRHTIHPRVTVLQETIEKGLLDPIDPELEFEIEEPTFEDPSAYLLQVQALEKLGSLGFDPVDAMTKLGMEEIAFKGKPEPPSQLAPFVGKPAAPQQPAAMEEEEPATRAAKADEHRRAAALDPLIIKHKPTVKGYLDAQRERLAGNVEAAWTGKSKSARKAVLIGDVWDEERELEEAAKALTPLWTDSATTGVSVAGAILGVDGRAVMDPVVDRVRAEGVRQVKTILTATKEELTEQLAEGARRGYSITQMVTGVPAEGFRGIEGMTAWDEYRAERIVRTETARAYNLANLGTYREFGVREVTAIDGDQDEMCAARNGRTFSVEDAWGEVDHPNGTLDWLPVTPERIDYFANTVTRAAGDGWLRLPAPVTKTIVQPQPVVVDTVPFAEALDRLTRALALQIESNRTPAPTRSSVKRVVRDGKGRIVQVIEESGDDVSVTRVERDTSGRIAMVREG